MRFFWRSLALAVLVSLLPVSTALAQEPTQSEIAEARALFMAGQAAVDSGRWADAVDSFSRAYDLSGVAAALYNLGFAYRALGRHVEARDAFDGLLDDHPRFDRQKRREARRYRDESGDRVAQITLSGLQENRRYLLRFDGQAVADDGTRPLLVEGDPGVHTLTVRTPGFVPFVWEDELRDGERTTVDVEMEEVQVGVVGAGGAGAAGSGAGSDLGGGSEQPEVDEGGIPGWGVAVIIAAVVVALVGGGIAAYAIYQSMQLQGESDRVYDL
ncbi:MAG: tetratricopeptide repeat protein [Deltaproteobacteria bacterium]|nr:tetratricopeptide repeat protein [Deltaproteobacteria bacterium]